MKTRLVSLLVVGLLACAQSGTAPPTRLSGTNSSAVSGSLLFVTSTRSNELRVLDLEPRSGQARDFVRAPNPLVPLSITTVPAPVEVSTPTRYGPLGQPLQGDWIFARGAGNPSVSIIGALNCPQQLKEFGRITPRPDSVVTALTSRLTVDDLQAQLYFTTFDGTDSTLWELILPNLPRDRSVTSVDPRHCNIYPGQMPQYVLQPLDVIRDEVVTAMVALPTVVHPGAAPDPEERALVIASRLLHPPVPFTSVDAGTHMSEVGRVRVVTPQPTGLAESYEAVFNSNTTVAESYPIKRLITHGNVVKLIALADAGTINVDVDGGVTGGITDVVMDAGTRIFAVLDEASCEGRIDCVGVMAVDLDRPRDLRQRLLPDGGVDLDGGTQVTRFPIAIDGFDDRRDLLDDGGVPVLVDGGNNGATLVPFQVADTYYRPPATFPDGGPRDANRMLPIRFANNGTVGIIQDITIQANGLALYLTGVQFQYGLLGFVSVTGIGNSIPAAQIFAFDAMTLRQINFAPNTVTVDQYKAVLNNGATATFRGGPQNIQIAQGIWPNTEGVFVLYEGIVAGIAGEPLDAGLGDLNTGLWPLSINSRVLAQQGFIEPGDLVIPVDYTGTECAFAFPVLPLGADGGVLVAAPGGLFLQTRLTALSDVLDGPLLPDGGGNVLVLPDGTVPTVFSCPPAVAYNLRSSSITAHPLTVSGQISGYLGRMALPPPNGFTNFDAGVNSTPQFIRFWRPDADAGADATFLTSTGLSFNIQDKIQYFDSNGQLVTDAGIEPVLTQGDQPALRGSGYFFHFLNAYTPASVPISSASLGVAGVNLPGALSLYQRNLYPLPANLGQDRVFVLYPGGNLIVDFSPTTVSYASTTTSDIGVHF